MKRTLFLRTKLTILLLGAIFFSSQAQSQTLPRLRPSDNVQHLKQLMLSRPYFSRIPTEEFILPDEVESAMPGAGRYRFVATIDSEGSYAMVYAPISRTFTVRSQMIKAEKIVAWWFCPRTAKVIKIGTFTNKPTLTFTPPSNGEAEDWVLVLDDASKHYPSPGKRYKH